MFDKLPISSKTEKILTKSLDEAISVEEANHLMNIKGPDLYPLLILILPISVLSDVDSAHSERMLMILKLT